MYSILNPKAVRILISLHNHPKQRKAWLYLSTADKRLLEDMMNDTLIETTLDEVDVGEYCCLSKKGRAMVFDILGELKNTNPAEYDRMMSEAEAYYDKGMKKKVAMRMQKRRERSGAV